MICNMETEECGNHIKQFQRAAELVLSIGAFLYVARISSA